MLTAILIVIILLFVINGVYGMYEEHRRGALCDCSGDCSKCKIQCQSNEKYYGKKQVGAPKELRPAYEASLLPENQPIIIRAIRKCRELFDLACYWLFNVFAIFAVGAFALSFVAGAVLWLKEKLF